MSKKVAIALMVAPTLAFAAPPNWIEVSGNADGRVYVDARNVQFAGAQYRTVWMKFSGPPRPLVAGDKRIYTEMVFHTTLDCFARIEHTSSTMYYAADGRVVYSDQTPDRPMQVVPGSVMDTAMDTICNVPEPHNATSP